MLIGFLRSGRDFRTVPGDVRGLSGLGKLTLGAVRQAGRLILRPPIEADRGAGGGIGRPPWSGALFDDVAVAGRSQARADAEQGVESRCSMAAAVPAEHELVEVTAQMGAAQAMEGA